MYTNSYESQDYTRRAWTNLQQRSILKSYFLSMALVLRLMLSRSAICLLSLLALVAWLVWWFPAIAVAADLDYDGLDDTWEDQLLQFHAPYLWLSVQEGRLPCDYLWFVQHSCLEYAVITGYYQGNPIFERFELLAQSALDAHPNWVLTASIDHPTYGQRFSDFLAYRRFPHPEQGIGIFLDLNNDYYAGQPKAEVLARRNVGMLGHVATKVVGNEEYACVQYWQLFAYNDMDLWGAGDHEGDWNMYEQFVRISDGVIVMAVWYHHGNKSIEYVAGIDPEDFRSIGGDDDDDLVSNIPSHDTVYVGLGSHEFYPVPVPLYPDDELQYQTTDVPNIGEILLPRLGHEVICRYNAYWGASGWSEDNPSPEGIMHNSGVIWEWPNETQIWVDPTGTWSGNTVYPNGSAGRPFTTLAAAATLINSGSPLNVGQRQILVKPGVYDEMVTINKPCRIIGATIDTITRD